METEFRKYCNRILKDENIQLQAEVERLRELLKEVLNCSSHALTPGLRYKTVNLHVDLLNDIVKALEGE